MKRPSYMLAYCIFEADCSWIGNHIIKHSKNSKSEKSLIVYIVLFNLFPKYVKSSEIEKRKLF